MSVFCDAVIVVVVGAVSADAICAVDTPISVKRAETVAILAIIFFIIYRIPFRFPLAVILALF